MTDREKDLEAIVRRLMPAARDIAWCALVWNDHNFGSNELLAKADRAASYLGFGRGPNAVDDFNDFMARVDDVLERRS